MTKEIPSKFVWTKMSAHAGEPLDNIIRRKMLEREAAGTVWWGVGENKGPAVSIHLDDCEPEILFSRTRRDSENRKPNCVVWTDYQVCDPNKRGEYGGEPLPVPDNVVVYSQLSDGEICYAIVCSDLRPCTRSEVNPLYVANMTNLNNDSSSGEMPGQQQTTCVVRYAQHTKPVGKPYPVEMRANLARPYFVKLVGTPIPLDDSQLQLIKKIGTPGMTVSDYRDVVRKIRG